MPEESHVRRRKGRFIKKSDPLKRALSITDFNLMEICDTPVTYADNVLSNIIHQKLHTGASLDEGVRKSVEIETIFEPAEFRPVIKPLDFTQEWIKQKKRLHSRHARSDDEDEIDIEMENIARKLRKKFSNKIKQQERTSEQNETRKIGDQLDFIEHIDDDVVDLQQAPATPPKPPPPQPPPQSMAQAQPPEAQSSMPNFDESPDAVEKSLNTLSEAIGHVSESQQDLPSVNVEKVSDMATPVIKKNSPDIQENVRIEVNEVERENIYQKARSDGFEDGYRDGEEKAMIAVQQRVDEILVELGKIVEEFSGLKSNILHSAQDNFQVICQTLLESLLQKEFKFNPDSFEAIIQKAISEAVPNDDFKVLVSQDTFARIKDHVSEKMAVKLKVDQELTGDNFKIESQLSVVDGNLSQIISDLLEQADISLFDNHDDKAG